MSTLRDHRVQPSDVSPDILRQLEALVREKRRPVLLGSGGERVELPQALGDMLAFVVEAARQHQSVVVMPEDAAFTTQAAAKLLGMSRPYLLRLLDAGKIP